MADDALLDALVRSAERACARLYGDPWNLLDPLSPQAQTFLYSRFCGAELRHVTAIAGRRVETVYSSRYT